MPEEPKPPTPPTPPAPPVEPPTPPTPPEPPKPPTPPQAPEKYELKMLDGSPLDPSDIATVSAFAKAKGLSNEQAQQLLDQRHEAAVGFRDRQQALLSQRRTEWEAAVKADKDLGGTNLPQTIQHIQRAMTRFATEEFKRLVDESGYGNHPEFVRVFAAIGKAMSEDRTILAGAGSGAPTEKPAPGKRMFPTAN